MTPSNINTPMTRSEYFPLCPTELRAEQPGRRLSIEIWRILAVFVWAVVQAIGAQTIGGSVGMLVRVSAEFHVDTVRGDDAGDGSAALKELSLEAAHA
jgi:hypothetical protein